MREACLVFLGGGLGALGRYALGLFFASWATIFPWTTLFVNLVGCFMMGALFAWFSAREALHPLGSPLGLFLAVGVLGGFTTFSAFALDALKLWQSGDYMLAFAYVVASVGLSLLAVVLGFCLVKVLG